MLAPWKKSYDKPRQCIKQQRHYFANNDPYSQTMVFPAVMYRCERLTMKSLTAEELMLLNCGAGEDSLEFLELQGDATSQS